MIERAVDRVWRVATSGWLLAILAAVAVGMVLVSLVAEQVALGAAVESAALRALLPGFVATHDLRHSLLLLVASLSLAAVLALRSVDRLLSDEGVSLRWAAGIGLQVASAATVVLVLAGFFLYRGVAVPLAPDETALLPALDATIRARVTGWLPDKGSFGTIEVAPRLAGGELESPFGDQDRPADAPLSGDAEQVELHAGGAAPAHGLRLALAAEPPGWAGRVRISWNGVGVTSPFLQSGQSWEAKALPLETPPLVAIDRVIPDFDPAVPITRQPLSGPAPNPAVVVTVHQAGEVVGSRALAPGEQVVLGGFTVLVEGFAPVLEVSVSQGASWWAAAAVAAAAATVCAGVWVFAVLRERRRPV